MENFMLNLFIVSVVTGCIIIFLKVFNGLFKNKYTVALKQFLWIVLALRLIVPLNYSHTILSVSATQYKDEDIITFSAKTMTQQESESTTYIAPLAENDKPAIVRQPSIEEFAKSTAEENDNTSQLLNNILEFEENEKLLSEEKNEHEHISIQYLFFQLIRFLKTHETQIISVYLGGMALFFLIHLLLLLLLYIKKHKHSSIIDEQRYEQLLKETADALHIKRIPKLLWMDDITSPMAIGFFRYTILLPKEDYLDKELRSIFTHELTHILHQDLRLKVLYLLANGIHWFNPLVYLMIQEACKDMELYCDYSVVELMDKEERMEYNELLLEILKNHRQKKMQSLLTTCFKGGVKEMKERFICNLDMRKKKHGILPTCLTAIIIILSAGLFSLNTVMIDVNADEMNSFWLNHPVKTEFDWEAYEENLNMQEEMQSNIDDPTLVNYSFKAGDPALPLKPRLSEGNIWQIPQHFNDSTGNVYVDYYDLEETEPIETLSAPPQIEIYCNNVQIEHYGVTLEEGWTDASNIIQNPDFFVEQAPKEQENPLFHVQGWMDLSGMFNLYFPEGQEPAFVDIEDTVLSENGAVRYPDYPYEIIYRSSLINHSMSNVSFELAEHYSIAVSENWITYEDLVHPYNRGYRIKCYWNTTQGLQSCTYYLVIRTQTTIYDEKLEKYQTLSGTEEGI